MPTNNPRINLTLPPHRYDLLKRLAALQGMSMSGLITDMLNDFYPVLERVCVVLEAAKQAQETSKAGLREAVAQAETELVPLLYKAVGQLDIFMEDAARSVGVELEANTKAAEAIKRAAAPKQQTKQTAPRGAAGGDGAKALNPRVVTRGSGSQSHLPSQPSTNPRKPRGTRISGK